MSEAPKRTYSQVQQEYVNLALKAGNIQYQMFILKKDLEVMNQSLRDLNFEAAKLQQEEVATAPVAEVSKEAGVQ